MRKPFLKNQIKIIKKQKINVKKPHVNKTLSEKIKFNSNKKIRPRMSCEWIGKKADQKIEKTVKIRVKLPHVNKKPLRRNRIFVQPPFSHSTLKLERKKFTPQNHSLFAPFPVSA